jgi:hypothetical protein
MLRIIAVVLLTTSCAFTPQVNNKKIQSFKLVKETLGQGDLHRSVLSSEGEWVQVFSPEMSPFIMKPMTKTSLSKISEILTKSIEIKLTDRGFVKAAERNLDQGVKDDTNYDAVWVRDSAWIALHFLESRQYKKARKLILALWDYYSVTAQINRIQKIIATPRRRHRESSRNQFFQNI